MSITVMILSGGRSRRFGGVHKPGVSLGGQTVISRILGTVRAAVPDAKVWVAGTLEGLTAAEAESVGNVREEPEFSGPLAGIDAAAQAMGESEVTLILAGDMPLVPAAHLRELIAACRASGLPAGASRSDAERAALLESASHIKHPDSSLSPVVAAFLAGRLHAADSDGASVTEALAEVERILTRSRD